MRGDGDTRSEMEKLNQAEEARQMQKHLPTNQELNAETHNHVRYQDGPLECTGRLEVLDAFGTKTEDAEGLTLKDSRFNKNTAITYDFVFVTVRCQDPECKNEQFVLDNPRRRERTKYKPASSWRTNGKKAASGEREPF